jgi:hypothetical protein
MFQGTKMYVEEIYTDYDHSEGAYSELSTTVVFWPIPPLP